MPIVQVSGSLHDPQFLRKDIFSSVCGNVVSPLKMIAHQMYLYILDILSLDFMNSFPILYVKYFLSQDQNEKRINVACFYHCFDLEFHRDTE